MARIPKFGEWYQETGSVEYHRLIMRTAEPRMELRKTGWHVWCNGRGPKAYFATRAEAQTAAMKLLRTMLKQDLKALDELEARSCSNP